MKKSIVLIALLFLSGCAFLTRKEPVPAATPQELVLQKKIGVVSTAEAEQIQTPLAFFYLVAENGEKIALESATVNLRRYKKRRVEAEGHLNNEKTIFLADTVTSLGQETDVKTSYADPEMGVRFDYPSLWELHATKNAAGISTITITPYEIEESDLPNVDVITVERSQNNQRLSAREWLLLDEEYRSTDPMDTSVYQASSLGSSSLAAVKKTSSDTATVEFFVSRDLFIYRLSHRTINDSEKDLYRNAFYDLVLSFNFIPFGAAPQQQIALPPPPMARLPVPRLSPPPEVLPPPPTALPAEATRADTSPPPSVQQGMAALSVRQFRISLQYPKNWYWAYENGEMRLSDKPVEADNILLALKKYPLGTDVADVLSCANFADTQFCISGSDAYRETASAIIKSIVMQ